MAYDEGVAQRVHEGLGDVPGLTERKMFGGLAFMVNGNMCCGVVGDQLMARVGPGAYDDALTRAAAREMDFTGRAMRGMVYVDPDGFETDDDLAAWLDLCLSFVRSLPPK